MYTTQRHTQTHTHNGSFHFMATALHITTKVQMLPKNPTWEKKKKITTQSSSTYLLLLFFHLSDFNQYALQNCI